MSGPIGLPCTLLFLTVVSLCIFILGNPDDPMIDDTMRAATRGRDILVELSMESTSAEKCVTTFEVRSFKASMQRHSY